MADAATATPTNTIELVLLGDGKQLTKFLPFTNCSRRLKGTRELEICIHFIALSRQPYAPPCPYTNGHILEAGKGGREILRDVVFRHYLPWLPMTPLAVRSIRP